jgi:hypothetical protein
MIDQNKKNRFLRSVSDIQSMNKGELADDLTTYFLPPTNAEIIWQKNPGEKIKMQVSEAANLFLK